MVRSRYPATPQDRMNAIMRHVSDQQTHVVMEFGSRLDEKVLERAMHVLLVREPALGWRWVERPRPHWHRRENLDSLPLFMLVLSNSVYVELDVFLTAPSDPGADPLVQARLFRGDVDLLCLKINHVVCDSVGAKEVAYELADIYSVLVLGENVADKNIEMRDRSMKPIWRDHTWSQRWKLRRRAIRAIRGQDRASTVWCFPFSSRESKDRRMLIKRYDLVRSGRISAFVKAQGATVNDVFLTAFIGSLFDIIRPTEGIPVPVQVAYDLRELSPNKIAKVANLGGALFPKYSRQPDVDMDGFLHLVHESMTSLEEKDDAAISIPFIEMVYGILPYGMSRKKFLENFDATVKRRSLPPLFSNVGILDAEGLSFAGSSPEHSFLTIPIAFPPLIMMGLSSYKGCFTLTLGFCSYGVERKDIEKLFDIIDERLPQ
jgi:NRPS condensation-like uncharacterized protein